MISAVFMLPFLCLASVARSYSLQSEWQGYDFYTWDWYTEDDPTHGRVNYVDLPTALNNNLVSVTNGTFIMRADSTNTVPPGSRGRNSIRIASPPNSTFDQGVLVLDLTHIPEGCTTWPAFWTLSKSGPWPQGGEIDIIEGVNLATSNLASLHTSPNCSMTDPRTQTGETVSTNCDASFNFNEGCGTSFTTPSSYGSGFNANGGGYYAMEKSENGIRVWFFPRNSGNIPSEITCSSAPSSLSTDRWKIPDAFFPTDSCEYYSHFDAHDIVFDLTFCGDWAGSAYSSSQCAPFTATGEPASCNDFVDNNPAAFSDAYWAINALRVYTI